jgi:integrase/recombinase XerD
MFNYSHEGVTIASMLDTRKANKDKKFPVKIRVTHNRIRKYYPTGKDLTQEEWSALPSTKSRTATELKNAIQISFETITKVTRDLINEGAFNLERLNSRLGRSTSGTMNTTFIAKIEELKSENRIGSKDYYENVLSSVERYKGKSIPFNTISVEWLKKYEKWLLSTGSSYTTIGMYMRAVRAIVNIAKSDGVIKPSDYPFGKTKYSIPAGEGRKLALTLPQIKKVVSFNDGLPHTPQYLALWFLSYLVNGANIGDLIRLKDSNFINGEIQFYRAKTLLTSQKKKKIFAVVTPEITSIIEKWGVPGRKSDDYIFPYLTGKETPTQEKAVVKSVVKRVNKRLKRIGDSMGITDFTTYSARHSFATVMKRSGANIEFISESLGHQDMKTTLDYLDSFEKSERLKNVGFLTNFGDDEE